ncbi:biotin--[acetyl-CoA-carboxylase] ligase [Mucilaginibacter galii]|uniref:Biotin--[acetyl-CoA-carboxylase] ligase n=1 Tax=Mucilaginibacter galii TaxID=2005073 RepID=A0A917J7E7_9SPHI|nr:biotin--[acetyl-CoA-carboxylase] ligase [Mucilaginibacter galii]GGI50049.1 biotin--[acetyl-CoA-carboxylase] ligase [Mucilaginibacter galii]
MQNNNFLRAFVGQNLITLKEVDSTNTFLKNILANNEPLPDGTVIMAESQIAGRGQQQNKWYSSTGESLAFSILLKPHFLALASQFQLTQIVSIGVYETLLPLVGNKLKIKWPNDIYVGGRKLGGILIENQVQGSAIKNSIIGIGLNVNQTNFPAWVPNAVSLRQILQTDYDLKALMFEICSHIERWYFKLKEGNGSQLNEAYLHSLYWLNKKGRFKVQDAIFEGMVTGVSAEGLLQVMQDGHVKAYNLKEIQFIHN